MRAICCAVVCLLGLAGAPRAVAQAVVVRNFAPVGGPMGLAPETLATVTYSSGYSVPYSYYAAWPYWPARGYVGYGWNDIFPYYGRPYGHPYDLWTWPYMSETVYGGALARYFYPPLQ